MVIFGILKMKDTGYIKSGMPTYQLCNPGRKTTFVLYPTINILWSIQDSLSSILHPTLASSYPLSSPLFSPHLSHHTQKRTTHACSLSHSPSESPSPQYLTIPTRLGLPASCGTWPSAGVPRWAHRAGHASRPLAASGPTGPSWAVSSLLTSTPWVGVRGEKGLVVRRARRHK